MVRKYSSGIVLLLEYCSRSFPHLEGGIVQYYGNILIILHRFLSSRSAIDTTEESSTGRRASLAGSNN